MKVKMLRRQREEKNGKMWINTYTTKMYMAMVQTNTEQLQNQLANSN